MGEATAPWIWTREGDAGRAREIVAEWNNARRKTKRTTTEDIAFPCPECSITLTFPTASRGHVEICPSCTSYVDVPD